MGDLKIARLPTLGLLLALALLSGTTRPSGEAAANRLLHESSPYLRLHAHNPVDWYPWGPEALERARAENKLIFLSVGYTTCYWCHVMEREVFSDPAIARLMNEGFVNIKVDREERPDLDDIYMTATQLLTGGGGWPNSVFLTPDLRPFFAGTYFPPEDRHGRPGFPKVLAAIQDAWRERRTEVLAQAERVTEAMRVALEQGGRPVGEAPAPAAASAAVAALKGAYDRQHGGIGGAPKFPSPANLFLLWRQGEAGDAEAREMVLETLRKMGRGAIYDQLDGGFHRYTLDAAWRVPHFEKMLYDNAHLGELLALAAAATGDAELERLARGSLDFVLGHLRHGNGAFKSAIDAETDGVEGAFYTWTREEFRAVLGDRGDALLAPIFGVDGAAELEGDRHTLHLTAPLAEHARGLGLSPAELDSRLAPQLDKLRRARARRPFPIVDDKVLADWNGMMIAALAEAGRRLGEPRYVAAAAAAADFVLGMRDGAGVQLHTWREGEAKIEAFLDDYAFLIRGLLALEQATGEERWLAEAERLAGQLEARLADPRGGYFQSAARPDLLVRVASAADGAIPSGNGVAALGLLRLAERTGRALYRQRALAALGRFADDLERHPRAAPTLALAVFRSAPAEEPIDEPARARMERLARGVVSAGARQIGDPGPDGWRPVAVDVDIQAGWHVNANPASLEFLIPTRIEGTVRGVAYPEGESLRFEFVDEAIEVYSGLLVLEGEVAPEASELRLTYQPCDDRRCLPPVTLTLPIESE